MSWIDFVVDCGLGALLIASVLGFVFLLGYLAERLEREDES